MQIARNWTSLQQVHAVAPLLLQVVGSVAAILQMLWPSNTSSPFSRTLQRSTSDPENHQPMTAQRQTTTSIHYDNHCNNRRTPPLTATFTQRKINTRGRVETQPPSSTILDTYCTTRKSARQMNAGGTFELFPCPDLHIHTNGDNTENAT